MNHSLRLTVVILLLAVSNFPIAALLALLETTNPVVPYAIRATAATNIHPGPSVFICGPEFWKILKQTTLRNRHYQMKGLWALRRWPRAGLAARPAPNP